LEGLSTTLAKTREKRAEITSEKLGGESQIVRYVVFDFIAELNTFNLF
jgi:hypothetical protein